ADLAVFGRGFAGTNDGFLEDRGGEETAQAQSRCEEQELERAAEHASSPSGRTVVCDEIEGRPRDPPVQRKGEVTVPASCPRPRPFPTAPAAARTRRRCRSRPCAGIS